MARGGWVYVGGRAGKRPSAGEKSVITAACEKFIAEVLKPRFLPVIRPTEFNYPIAIYGKWHGNKYRFITRFRSDDPRSYEPEFEAPFARLEYVSRDRFDLLPPAYRWVVLHLWTRLARGGLGSDRERFAFSAMLTEARSLGAGVTA
jgi:hypothetical protein